MKILIVSGSFYPINSPRAFRTTELVKEFTRLNHEVTVCIPNSSYDYSDFLKQFPVSMLFYNRPRGKKTFTKIGFVDRVICRILGQFCNYPHIAMMKYLRKVLIKESGYDMVITIAVPHTIHWTMGNLYRDGYEIAEKWVADCGDPFMHNKSNSYRTPFYFKYIEKRWCRYCDSITVPTETSYLGYYPEFKDKIHVIPQGFNFKDVALTEYKPNEVPTFAFAGSFIPGRRDPRKLFEFLNAIGKPYKFIVYGTSDKSRWADLIEQSDGKIVFEKPIPRIELLKVLSQMDFLINIGNGTNVQTPSKLIDYTLTKRPILTVETNDIKANVLREFLEGNYEHKDADIDISKYDIHNVAQQFLDLCK